MRINRKFLIFFLLLTFSVSSFAYFNLIAQAGAAIFARVGGQAAFNRLVFWGSSVGAAAYVSQQINQIKIDDPNDTKPPLIIPSTGLTRDRPVSAPNAVETFVPSTVLNISAPTPSSSLSTACQSLMGTQYYTYTDGFGRVVTYSLNGTSTQNPPVVNQSAGVCFIDRYYNGAFNVQISHTLYYSSSSTTQPCGDGYTNQSGTCVLTNRDVIPDDNCDLVVTGGNYAQKSGDPDCLAFSSDPPRIESGVVSVPMQLLVSDAPDALKQQGEVVVFPENVANNCYYSTCIPVAGLPGHYRIAALQNTSSGNAQASVMQVRASDGVVTDVTTVPITGMIVGAGTAYTNTQGQVVTVPVGQTAIVQAGTSGYTQVVNPTVPLTAVANIPSDYARTGEVATAASSINTNVNQQFDAQAVPITSVTGAMNDYYDAQSDSLNPTQLPDPQFNLLPSLLPGDPVACVPLEQLVTVNNNLLHGVSGLVSVDICDKLYLARQILGWLLAMSTIFFVFRAFVNSNRGF